MLEKSRRGRRTLAPIADVAEAHRQVPIHPHILGIPLLSSSLCVGWWFADASVDSGIGPAGTLDGEPGNRQTGQRGHAELHSSLRVSGRPGDSRWIPIPGALDEGRQVEQAYQDFRVNGRDLQMVETATQDAGGAFARVSQCALIFTSSRSSRVSRSPLCSLDLGPFHCLRLPWNVHPLRWVFFPCACSSFSFSVRQVYPVSMWLLGILW